MKTSYFEKQRIEAYKNFLATKDSNTNNFIPFEIFSTWYIEKGYTIEKTKEIYNKEKSQHYNDDNFTVAYYNNNGFKISEKITINQKSGFTPIKKSYDKKHYNNIDNFISDNYIFIAKRLIKSMCYSMVITKNNKVIYPHFEALKDIVNNNYNDSFFDDISQEVGLYLFEHKDQIIINNDTIDFSSIWLDMYKHIRNFLYMQKKRYENKEVCIIAETSDENDGDGIAISVNSLAFKELIQNDIYTKDDTTRLNDIFTQVKTYLYKTQPKNKYERLCLYMDLKANYLQKDICKIIGVSSTTATTYNDILKNAFYHTQYNFINTDNNKIPATKDKDNNKDDKIIIDNKEFNSNAANVIIKRLNNKDHNEKQGMYNKLFNALDEYVISIRSYYKYSRDIKRDNIKSVRMDTYMY